MQLAVMLGLPIGLVIWGLYRLAVLRRLERQRERWLDSHCYGAMLTLCRAQGRHDLALQIMRQNR